MQPDLYDVTLVGFPGGTGSAESAPQAVARIFGIDLGQAESVVATTPVVIKHGATAHQARAYGSALQEIGAKVRLDPAPHAPPADTPRGPAQPPTAPQGVGYDDPAQPPRSAPSASTGPASGQGGHVAATCCAHHPGTLAVETCAGCGAPLCAGCVSRAPLGGTGTEATFCPQCHPMHAPVAGPPTGSFAFLSELPKAFLYPFRGRGALLLVIGALFFAGASFIASISIFGFLLTFFVFGYLTAYMWKVLSASADGDDEAPDWPDFGNWWDDVIRPVGQVIAICVVCFGPAIVPFFVLSIDVAVPVALLLLMLGTVLVPMAIMSVAIHRSSLALDPRLIWHGLATTWKVYPVALMTMLLVYGGVTVLQLLPGVGMVIGSFLTLWLVLVEMRILGVLYRTHRDELGWG